MILLYSTIPYGDFQCLSSVEKKEETFTLVSPEKSNLEQGRISILTEIGTAIIGYRVGDLIELDFPSG
ncbi:MAG: GreA/GreB family elongation factor [Syntrophaceae bacterium]|nr:GreA/GreB family elongation factor [Syntrophaceae bacterium]